MGCGMWEYWQGHYKFGHVSGILEGTVMDCNVFTTHCLSATLQYVGVRFRCFIHALQKSGEDSIRDKTDWYSNVQTEVL